jgi:NAD(P)-dependent dehydrogenase (short-subunit alcohol dehydrogenase family)
MNAGGRLAGKRAIVTGASSGIGRAIAVAFAAEGARVGACGRNPERTRETCADIERTGGEVLEVSLDVTVPAQIQAAVDKTVGAFGGLDVVVNCAGISEVDGWVPVHEHSLDGWNQTIAVDLTAPFLMSKAALPHLVQAGGGALVHISSIAGEIVLAGNAAYGAAKAGLIHLSNHIAVEYASQGIRSNAILPGEIETPASTRAIALAVEAGEFTREELLARYPGGRFGTPEEVAATAVFLCSDEARFLSGASLAVDGAYIRI